MSDDNDNRLQRADFETWMKFEGMTLRDWFAGQALTGLLSDVITIDDNATAKLAYRYADAMLKAREKSE